MMFSARPRGAAAAHPRSPARPRPSSPTAFDAPAVARELRRLCAAEEPVACLL
ncbi:MAG: hypothetical protein R3F43_08245 [bacterium]